ncbi:amidase [Nocardioides donggukensis]|uniref:Asp-tRNA(Asn)/Glu-tRNA(Gln) amidotransferase GatCAB subunit A n=1 Tax=Nocardioides donggukensis TaxID=2774019 RepID=A0A927PZJ9_9ACTN|nr:amidase [Nocardioides donggukensis]MBD8870328.1 Asp-tRNA(Asn)/Glu-tRNA(Gln) amidotransferase GatCAB subunit A [Nocardioides donggukensis]
MSLHLEELWARERELNAFVHLDPDAVRRAGSSAGPLAGRPVAVKDNIAVRGAPWACGSATRRDRPPAGRDAEVVRRVRAAGGLVLGTTNLDELAMGASTESSASGATRNPHDLDRTPGGSSGGSAAAVAAYGVLAIGTDTGGSIREPAAMCGVVGVAPSPGTVPVDGVVPFAPSLDRVGPLAPDLRGAALLHEVLAGVEGLVASTEAGARDDLVGWTVGVIEPMTGERNAPEVVERFEVALGLLVALGATAVPVTVPRFGDLLDVYLTVSSVEALPVLEEHAVLGPLGPEAASRLAIGRRLCDSDVHREAVELRERMVDDVERAFGRCEVMLSPTVPLVAPRLGRPGMGDPLSRPRTDWWTVEANLAGVPAMSVPAGLGAGLPVGVQLMAPAGLDRCLYRVGSTLEAALSGEHPRLPARGR